MKYKYTVVRDIAYHSNESGLVSKYVAKVVESDVPPQVGYGIDDSAWHRNDVPKVESVEIDTASGVCTVRLEQMKVGSAQDVERAFRTVLQHPSWKDWLK